MKKDKPTNLSEQIDSSIQIESLLLRLEEIEKEISEGNLKISQQIELLTEAKNINTVVKKSLEETKTLISLIDSKD
jgi:hypothetical protein